MRWRVLVAASCCVLISAGCTPAQETRTADGASPAPSEAGIFEVVGDCTGLRKPRGAQLSFVSGDKLLLARPGETVARCALEIDGTSDLEWGPKGDRVHFGDLRRYDGDRITSPDGEPESVSWSRPTGTSLVFVSEGRLMKVEAFGNDPVDISFLADHDEVVYHPAGTHVAVAGTDDDGTYGVWLATNVGKEPQLLAVGEDARRIFSLVFGHDGTTLYYAAEHDDHHDVHALRLALKDAEGRTRDAKLNTLESSPGEMGDVVVSEFREDRVAYTVGSCAEGKQTRVWNGRSRDLGGVLAERSTQPLGWLPTGGLLVLARDSGCTGEGTLYLWRSRETKRLAAGVSAAGVRAVLPPPPNPPGSEQEVVA